ncbi:uncharacterized protein LOC118479581 [Helianthus annuus]|uniref:uncharacterized protein LOC118479581 n=1 Tax=Helianthus annuus TaxID=4232 RepID=UPI001652C2A0|nr:uncharacterized protein LOC118479581 [Helianthus annuus]
MSKRLFLCIVDDLKANYDYFKQKVDARGALGYTGIQKCTSALRILAYGNTTDINDEYLKMGIIDLYGARYLRTPTWDDLQKIYEVHSMQHGLPGMIGSLDCMHWHWDNCPTAWRGQHTRGDQKGPTVILQAVASQDLWEWISGKAPKASFYANGNYYPHGYYLCDGIYPSYSIFLKTFSDPIDEKRTKERRYAELCARSRSTGASTDVNGRRVNNARELHYEPYHSALTVDLVQHAWSVRYVPPEGEEETEDEEDEVGEGEESEDEN